jgi:hypothetical protein
MKTKAEPKLNHSNEYRQDLKKFPNRNGRSFHHFHYRHLRDRQSIYWLDGMYLPQWLHVPIIHRILGGGERAGSQRFGRCSPMSFNGRLIGSVGWCLWFFEGLMESVEGWLFGGS